ncbi:hypothetical protein [Serratia fonticola]|uniref:hypothetical protein n=1 Tax=Serratia fonticola TaxID=47917 RepID=UPI0024DE41FD|nr:hypothetical protein [Serratia fonticola]MDK2376138.1 hypothetical protein [Serratia fonticola]
MNIYTLNQNYDEFKYYLPVEGSEIISKLRAFNGQSLAGSWRPYEFEIFSGKTKSERNRREDFNVSHYHPRLLLMDETMKKTLQNELREIVEFLPIITSDKREFFFLNVLNVKDAIATDSWDEYESMEDTENYIFRGITDNDMIFRDSKFNLNYFITEKFFRILKDLDIKGGYFKEVGVV